jgi:hypothetical protein
LAPGLSNVTTRVQGYGLLCAGLEICEKTPVQGLSDADVWLRFERLWVTAQTAYGGGGWPGNRVAQQMIDRGEIDLTVPFLGQQLAAGSWGAYRRSAGLMGLIKPAWRGAEPDASMAARRGTAPGSVACTVRGERVARRWREQNLEDQVIAHTVAKAIAKGTVDLDTAWSLFKPDKPPFDGICRPLSVAVENSALKPGLEGLRRVWDEGQSLAPSDLRRHENLLDDSQTGLPQQAEAVDQLFRLIEKPFRAHLRSGDGPGPEKAVWEDPCWSIAARESADMAQLRNAGSRTPGSWTGVESWAAELARRRGKTSTAAGQAPAGYDKATSPAMSLRAAAALFTQGLLGEPQTAPADVSASLKRALASAESEGER